jgi:hypothetical protein
MKTIKSFSVLFQNAKYLQPGSDVGLQYVGDILNNSVVFFRVGPNSDSLYVRYIQRTRCSLLLAENLYRSHGLVQHHTVLIILINL